MGLNAFNSVTYAESITLTGFLFNPLLNITDYISQIFGLAVVTLDQGWKLQLSTTVGYTAYDLPIFLMFPSAVDSKLILPTFPTQYELGATLTGTNDFTAGALDYLFLVITGDTLAPYSATHYFEITGTGITQADFITPNPISGTFIPSSSASYTEITPDVGSFGKSFTYSVYLGSDNTGTLVVSDTYNIV